MKDEFDMIVERTAKQFNYPPTPDVASRLAGQFLHQSARRRRKVGLRLAQAALVMLLALAALLTVPEIRAQVMVLFRIGAVELIATTATPAVFDVGDIPSSVLDYPGATTLDSVRQRAPYAIPTSPVLGAPDRVYWVDALRPVVVLAWLDADGAVDTSLHLLPAGTYALKMQEGEIVETQVNGARALWLPDTHWYMLQIVSDRFQMRRVETPALVWATETMTYRLETPRPLDEALHIAETLDFGNG